MALLSYYHTGFQIPEVQTSKAAGILPAPAKFPPHFLDTRISCLVFISSFISLKLFLYQFLGFNLYISRRGERL